VARNPDTIQREIEQTRAELADTIDAIAERISPRRAASRSAHAIKSQVSSVLGGHSNGHSPAAVLDAKPAAAGAGGHTSAPLREQAIRSIESSGAGASYTGTHSYAIKRSLRFDRVLLAVGAAATVAGAIIVWRSRD